MTLHFFRNRRQAFAASRDAAHRDAMLKSHVEVVDAGRDAIKQKDGDLVLTDRQRARLATVSKALTNGGRREDGENLYAKSKDDINKDAGGVDMNRAALAKELAQVRTAMSDARFLDLSLRWADKTLRSAHSDRVYVTPALAAELGLDDANFGKRPTTLGTDSLSCTFCGSHVEKVRATHGHGELKKGWRVERREVDGRIIEERKMFHFTESQVACPDCVLHITASVGRCTAQRVIGGQSIRCRGTGDYDCPACHGTGTDGILTQSINWNK